MAETDKHAELMIYFRAALKAFFDSQPNVYVSGNNFVFWEEGNPKARLSPDAYVVFGVAKHLRDSYKAWEEGGRLPDVVFEFTSKKTQREDTDTKLPRYEQTLRTPEYFLFDPTGDYLRPRLQGYRLENGRYVRLELIDDRLHSERLGLDLVQEGENLRLFDPAGSRFLLTPLEQARRADEQTRRADEQTRRADEQTRRAEEQARRAEEQTRRAEDAEAEIARLRAALRNQE